jgi:hypothetical protein
MAEFIARVRTPLHRRRICEMSDVLKALELMVYPRHYHDGTGDDPDTCAKFGMAESVNEQRRAA